MFNRDNVIPAVVAAMLVGVGGAGSTFLTGTPESTKNAVQQHITQLGKDLDSKLDALKAQMDSIEHRQRLREQEVNGDMAAIRRELTQRTQDRWSRRDQELLWSHLKRLVRDRDGTVLPGLEELVPFREK